MNNKKSKLIDFLSVLRTLTAALFIPLLISPQGLEGLFLMNAFVWGIMIFITQRQSLEYVLGNKLFWVNLCYPALLYLIVNITNGLFIRHSILLPIIIFYLLFYYENGGFQSIEYRIGMGTAVGYLILIHFYTIYMLNKDVDISRNLASSAYSEQYANMWTGGYDHIYLTMLGSICLFAIILKCKENRLRWGLFLLEMIQMVLLFKAGYTMALLFTVGGFMLIILLGVKENRKLWLIILTGMLLFPLIVMAGREILMFLAEHVSNRYMHNRLVEVANLLKFSGLKKNGSIDGRLSLYRLSAETFFHHPLIGVGNSDSLRKVLYGGHSTIIDKLANFGLIGGGTYLALILYNFKSICKRITKKHRYIYMAVFLIYFLLSVVNITDLTALNAVVFLIIPAGICIYSDREQMKK